MLNHAATCHYRPQTKLLKGNVFTSVCQEFCPQWRCTPPPPRQTANTLLGLPPSQTPPSPGQTPAPHQTATVADDTHPTGMHSCLQLYSQTILNWPYKHVPLENLTCCCFYQAVPFHNTVLTRISPMVHELSWERFKRHCGLV